MTRMRFTLLLAAFLMVVSFSCGNGRDEVTPIVVDTPTPTVAAELTPIEPAPIEPAPVDPAPLDPTPADTAPQVEPTPPPSTEE